jgi:hypothetical protein
MLSDPQSLPAQVAITGRYQFSIRGLLLLTLAACICLTIASLCGGSEYFGALTSPWTWATLAMIAASWIVSRRVRSPRWVLRSSIVAYGLSLVVPALVFDAEIAFGYRLWETSVFGSWGFVHDWIYPPPPYWLNISLGLGIPISAFIGLAANVMTPASWIAYYIAWRKQERAVWGRRLAWGSVAAMVLCIIVLSCAIPVPVLLPGFALWVASALSLALRW